jgi:hypothetical protein
LHKNKELLTKVVAETSVEGVECYSKGVLDSVKFAPNLGLSWGGDEKSLLDLFLGIEEEWEPIIGVSALKVKGKRELKNLECSINFEARGRRTSLAKCQRQRVFLGLKMYFPFLLRCSSGMGFLGWFVGL